jgi:hypothetical protein
MVKPGDTVGRGQILAKGNYTDKEGVLALGRNLRVAYLPFDSNYEDAMVISESAAKKLTSVHSSPLKFDAADGVEVSRDSYVSLYPGRFNRDQVKNVGADGVVKPGTVVKPGDPLVLAVGTRRPRIGEMLHRSGKSFNSDQTMTWDHDDEGVVTDTYRDENGAVKVHVKYNKSSEVADKFSNRFGAKGVVSRIVPDDKMPRDKDGNSMEVILNPLGTISRVNSTALAEVLLGKIAAKTGKPYNLRNGQNLAEFALSELSKNGIDETEELFDPTTNRKLKGILTGNTFLMKLHHVAEGKAAARDTGSYTSDDQPAKGGSEGAKRFALMDLTALLSSGGIETLKDAKLIRGQRNDKFWEAYRSGGPVKLPGRPFVYDKFLNMLRGAGVNISDSPDSVSLRPVTKADIAALNPGAWRHLRPQPYRRTRRQPMERHCVTGADAQPRHGVTGAASAGHDQTKIRGNPFRPQRTRGDQVQTRPHRYRPRHRRSQAGDPQWSRLQTGRGRQTSPCTGRRQVGWHPSEGLDMGPVPGHPPGVPSRQRRRWHAADLRLQPALQRHLRGRQEPDRSQRRQLRSGRGT